MAKSEKEDVTALIDKTIAEQQEREAKEKADKSSEEQNPSEEEHEEEDISSQRQEPDDNEEEDDNSSHDENNSLNQDTFPNDTSNEDDIDYKKFYETITAPIKVRGKERIFKRENEIRSLVSKGVDYSYKLGQLNKSKHLVSLLQKNEIDDTTLRSLIDVAKGDKDAILYFARKAGIDFDDVDVIDSTNNSSYEPKTQDITEEQQAFNDAIASVQSDSLYGTLIWNFLNELDAKDVEVLFRNPENIITLLNHAHMGIFQKVIEELEHRFIVGTLPTRVQNLKAYNEVFSQLVNAGAFASAQQRVTPTRMTAPRVPPKNETRRKGVSPTRRSVPPIKNNNRSKVLSLAEINKITDRDKFSAELAKFEEAQRKKG